METIRLTIRDLRLLARGMPYADDASRIELLTWLDIYRPDLLAGAQNAANPWWREPGWLPTYGLPESLGIADPDACVRVETAAERVARGGPRRRVPA
jgi:hypothetical protein